MGRVRKQRDLLIANKKSVEQKRRRWLHRFPPCPNCGKSLIITLNKRTREDYWIARIQCIHCGFRREFPVRKGVTKLDILAAAVDIMMGITPPSWVVP